MIVWLDFRHYSWIFALQVWKSSFDRGEIHRSVPGHPTGCILPETLVLKVTTAVKGCTFWVVYSNSANAPFTEKNATLFMGGWGHWRFVSSQHCGVLLVCVGEKNFQLLMFCWILSMYVVKRYCTQHCTDKRKRTGCCPQQSSGRSQSASSKWWGSRFWE